MNDRVHDRPERKTDPAPHPRADFGLAQQGGDVGLVELGDDLHVTEQAGVPGVVPPLFIGSRRCTPLVGTQPRRDLEDTHDSGAGGRGCGVRTVIAVAVRDEDQVPAAFGSCPFGKLGLPLSHGSNSRVLPPRVLSEKALCPSHVIGSVPDCHGVTDTPAPSASSTR